MTAYWDARIHKYVVYLRGRPNVRPICMSESEDFINWSPRKIIIQPDEYVSIDELMSLLIR